MYIHIKHTGIFYHSEILKSFRKGTVNNQINETVAQTIYQLACNIYRSLLENKIEQ